MEFRVAGRRLPILMLTLVALATGVARAEEVIDRVLAIVGGEIITLTDVMAAHDLGLVSAGPADDPVREILPRLIDREMILAEVDRYVPPEPSAEAVDAEMRATRGRFASDQAFQTALSRSGIDESHLRETLRQDLRIRAYLEQRFAVPPLSDEELGRYYREHLPAFTRGGEVMPLATVRGQLVQAATAERREQIVNKWVAGLRRRTEIIDLSLTTR